MYFFFKKKEKLHTNFVFTNFFFEVTCQKMWFVLISSILHHAQSRSDYCCKYDGGDICSNFICCPIGGHPYFGMENNTRVCRCTSWQECAAPPTYRPTHIPYPDFPSPPTSQPQPTTSLPSSQYPSNRLATYRPTHSPTTQAPNQETVITKKNQDALVTTIVCLILIGILILAVVLCVFIRKRKLNHFREEFVVLEENV